MKRQKKPHELRQKANQVTPDLTFYLSAKTSYVILENPVSDSL
jgi:hypothetical protein